MKTKLKKISIALSVALLLLMCIQLLALLYDYAQTARKSTYSYIVLCLTLQESTRSAASRGIQTRRTGKTVDGQD
jgi:hypothetical protein